MRGYIDINVDQSFGMFIGSRRPWLSLLDDVYLHQLFFSLYKCYRVYGAQRTFQPALVFAQVLPAIAQPSNFEVAASRAGGNQVLARKLKPQLDEGP